MARMKMVWLVVGLVAFALAAAPEAAAQKKPVKKAAAAAHSMTGCLAKGEGKTFTLTNVEGTGPKTVEIVSMAPTVKLAPHVGHKIEITGTTVAAKQAAKMEGTKTKDEQSEHHMRVQAVKMIAASCP